MTTLENTINLLKESLDEAKFYAGEVETLLKETKPKTKEHNELKQKENKEKNPPEKRS